MEFVELVRYFPGSQLRFYSQMVGLRPQVVLQTLLAETTEIALAEVHIVLYLHTLQQRSRVVALTRISHKVMVQNRRSNRQTFYAVVLDLFVLSAASRVEMGGVVFAFDEHFDF